MSAAFKVGDRVRWRAECDPMTALNARLGLTSPDGTVIEIWDDGTALVVWDSSEGEARGNSSPHAPAELEPAGSSTRR